MQKNIIISFGGNIGTGKSTVAKMLQERLSHPCINSIIIPVSKAIKDEVSYLYGISSEIMFDDTKKYTYYSLEHMTDEGVRLYHDCKIVTRLIDPRMLKCTPRQLMQIHATEIRRTWFGNDYWELRFKEAINEFFNQSTNDINIVLHDDLRFKGEVVIVDQFNNFKFKLGQYPGYSIDISHSSEHDLDTYTEWDYTFDIPGFGKSYLHEVVSQVWEILYNKDIIPLEDITA